jgi:hypothetical protein
MDYSRKMSASDGSNNNKITFEEIAPDWSKRLNKLTTAKGISYEKDTMYSDISDYKKCIVGEAFGYSPSYVLYGTINHCMKCTGFSHDFAYAARDYDSDKLIDTKQKLTEHWNEVDILLPRGYVVMQRGISSPRTGNISNLQNAFVGQSPF